jgi:hypothetical protein
MLKRFLCRRHAVAAAIVLGAASRRYGQAANPTPFEVASIRPNSDNGTQRFSLFPQFTARNATLKDLFLLAYDVKGFQVTGGLAG